MLAGLSPSQLADANTLFNVGQRLGGSIGVGLLATFFTLRVTARVRDVLGPAASRLGTGSLASAPPRVRPRLADAAMAGFHDTIWVGVGIAAVAVLCALFLRPAVLAGGGRPEHATAEQPKAATTQASPA
jgi:hypothetical protein